MDIRIPPLKTKIMLESNPLKSRILVRRLAVVLLSLVCWRLVITTVPSTPMQFRLRDGPGDEHGAVHSLIFRDFKDAVQPFFESDTLFLEY